MSTPENASNFTSIAPIVTWLIVIAGWVVVNIQHNNRESRKELRARIEALRASIGQIEQDAISYHTSGRDDRLGLKIKLAIEQIANDVEVLHQPLGVNLAYSVFQFRKSVTLRNFDSSNHVALDAHDTLIQEIAAAIQRLISELESAYSKKYHLPWYKKIHRTKYK